MKRSIAALGLTLLFAAFMFADVPRPDKPKPENSSRSIDTYLQIQLDKNAKEARLIIPRDQLKQLRAELDALDNGTDNTAASGGITGTQTVAAGLLLSLAFAVGGILMFKPGRLGANGRKAAAGMAVVFAGGSFAAIVFGNAGPPPEARSITGLMFTRAVHLYGFGSGKIKLEVSDKERNPKLIVPNPPEENKKTDEE